MYGSQIHKSTLLIKNGSNAISILYTGSHKSFLILIGEMFKVYALKRLEMYFHFNNNAFKFYALSSKNKL